MTRELGRKLGDLGLELLNVGQQSEDECVDGGRRSLPVRLGNIEGRRTLAHAASMTPPGRTVKR